MELEIQGKKVQNRSFVAISAISIAACLIVGLSVSSAGSAELAPGLNEIFNSDRHEDSLIDIVLFLDNNDQQATIKAISIVSNLKRHERIRRVLSGLKKSSSSAANEVRALLTSETDSFREFWITPSFAASVSRTVIERLMDIEGVRLIAPNFRLEYIQPVEAQTAPALATSVSGQLALLNVPALWNLGLTGSGRLVCSFDTGVEYDHPALSARWRGVTASLQSSWFSKVDPTSLPLDKVGHGTHTMGVMVGAMPADTFGVAWEAEWITAGVVDQGKSLSATLADIVEAFQWALNPDGDPNTTSDVPDVILNSWGIPKGMFAPCDNTFGSVIAAVEAAGIVTIFAAGNEGPSPMSMRSPSDNATSPLNAFSVGAVDNQRLVASFSSRGPSSCDGVSIKPEIVAPGVGVRSSYKEGGFFTMSGSSMAAPYIAGLVALLRQYNPDATVAEIKNAFIQAAVDLGPIGQDNSYGHGLVDASRLLQFMPQPTTGYSIVDRIIVGNGIARPGEQFQLDISISRTAAGEQTVIGRLSSGKVAGVTILENETSFDFGIGSSTVTGGVPFQIALDDRFYNGEEIQFDLVLSYADGTEIGILPFNIQSGIIPPGHTGMHSTSRIQMTVSDFGQYGLAPSSIYNVNGAGFSFDGSSSLLYEAGLILGYGDSSLSSSVRGADGSFKPSDFVPIYGLTPGRLTIDGGFHRTAAFGDPSLNSHAGIFVNQETISFEADGENSMVIFKYQLINNSGSTASGLSLGFLADFDLPGGNERISFDNNFQLIFIHNDSGPMVGLLALEGINIFRSAVNYVGDSDVVTKTGLSDADKVNLLSFATASVDSSLSGDLICFIGRNQISLAVGDSSKISFAVIAANTEAELYDNAQTAIRKFGLLTSVEEKFSNVLPKGFKLRQNYPNPFNPTTTISFSLNRAGDASLEIYNMMGQKVRTLFDGWLTSGYQEFQWDSGNDSGQRVASGIYFYRLQTAGEAESRKMILLK